MKLISISILTIFCLAGLSFADICNTCGIMRSGTCPLKCTTAQSDAKKTITKTDKKPVKKIIKKNATAPKKPSAASIKADGKEMKPVKSVNSKERSITEQINDASITIWVKMTLLYHRSASAVNTKVSTNRGLVILSGTARSNAEKTLAGKLANDIKGVMGVVNNMSIADKPGIGGQDTGNDDACGNEKDGANSCKIK